MQSSTAATTGLVIAEAYVEHLTGKGHPEQPGRVTAIVERLQADGLLEKARTITPRTATDEEILRCHAADYLRIVNEDVTAGPRVGRLRLADRRSARWVHAHR